MYGLFKDVKPLVAPKPFREYPRPDNGVFKLHYRVSDNKLYDRRHLLNWF